MNVPIWVWILTIGVTTAILLFDVFIIGRRPHVPSNRETGSALAMYVGLALALRSGRLVLRRCGVRHPVLRGLADRVLALDRQPLRLPHHHGQVRRAGEAPAVGADGRHRHRPGAARHLHRASARRRSTSSSWVFYLFGAFLIYTAVKLAREGDNDDDEFEENRFLKWVERRFPATNQWHGAKLFARENGSRLITPMFIVILALGTTDLLFALDSIPAIYGLTQEPFLVLTANIFALMGLRQLYFLIGGLLKRLVYLGIGLAILLAFIGVKLILHAMHVNELPFINGGEPVHAAPDIGIVQSLSVIVGILAVTTVASLVKTRRDNRSEVGG